MITYFGQVGGAVAALSPTGARGAKLVHCKSLALCNSNWHHIIVNFSVKFKAAQNYSGPENYE